jgi:hypothetical protein
VSKLAEALRAIRIFNNYDILRRFGDEKSVVIDYHARAEGRMGWATSSKSVVWSPRPHSKLEREPIGGSTYRKEFIGNRSESYWLARNWAAETFGDEYVPSPHGGLIPKHVKHKAEQAAKAGKANQ